MDVAKELVVSKNQLIEWRRHFHKYPELSFQEEKTITVCVRHTSENSTFRSVKTY